MESGYARFRTIKLFPVYEGADEFGLMDEVEWQDTYDQIAAVAISAAAQYQMQEPDVYQFVTLKLPLEFEPVDDQDTQEIDYGELGE